MDKIIDVNTNKQYSIFSKTGKQILKSYVKFFNGGSDSLESVDSIDLVHYFYHIQVNGEDVRDGWDQSNDYRNEETINTYFDNNRSIYPREHVDLSDMTTGYLVLSFDSGEVSKIPETITLPPYIRYDELGLPIDGFTFTLKKRNMIPPPTPLRRT